MSDDATYADFQSQGNPISKFDFPHNTNFSLIPQMGQTHQNMARPNSNSKPTLPKRLIHDNH